MLSRLISRQAEIPLQDKNRTLPGKFCTNKAAQQQSATPLSRSHFGMVFLLCLDIRLPPVTEPGQDSYPSYLLSQKTLSPVRQIGANTASENM